MRAFVNRALPLKVVVQVIFQFVQVVVLLGQVVGV